MAEISPLRHRMMEDSCPGDFEGGRRTKEISTTLFIGFDGVSMKIIAMRALRPACSAAARMFCSDAHDTQRSEGSAD